MIHLKTEKEIVIMQEGGKKLKGILDTLISKANPGISTKSLDQLADELIVKSGGVPSFKKVPQYHWATCMSVNDMVVHGIPTETPLNQGDILGIDVGLFYKGFHTDTSWSMIVKYPNIQRSKDPKIQSEKERFLEIGERALELAIAKVKPGNRIGHISEAIQKTIEDAGYNIVRELVGHGVGKKLHEEPEVPGILTKKIDKTPLIREGMALAVEVIYNAGKPGIIIADDGWTIRSKDGTLSGLFEKTVIAKNHGVLVLT